MLGLGSRDLSRYETKQRVLLLPVDSIDPNPLQPRTHLSEETIAELAASIRTNGLLQPITVRRAEERGRFVLVAGQRRLLAVKALGEETIPALVEDRDDQSSAVVAIVENLQRQDLDCFEEAEAIRTLMDLWGLTQQQAAHRLGKSQPAIANKLRLLKLPSQVRVQLQQAGMSERHCRALLRLCGDPRLEAAAERVIQKGMTVSQTEQLVERMLEEKKKSTRILVVKDYRLFLNTVNRAVSLMKEAGVPVENRQEEDDTSVTYTITVPKSAVYRTGAASSADPDASSN